MPEGWTGRLVGRMHNCGVTMAELAAELGVSAEYVSLILHGRRRPDSARERLEGAFAAIIARRRAGRRTQ